MAVDAELRRFEPVLPAGDASERELRRLCRRLDASRRGSAVTSRALDRFLLQTIARLRRERGSGAGALPPQRLPARLPRVRPGEAEELAMADTDDRQTIHAVERGA